MIKNFFVSALILILLGTSVFFGITTFKSKEKEIEHDGLLRKYRLHVPSGYFEKDSYPLVVALHGHTENARTMEIRTGLSRKADRDGFFVAYPYGVQEKTLAPRSWNSEFCCDYALKQNIDDVGFVTKVIDEVAEKYNIDTKKVYVVGFSNGGMLAYQMALKKPEIFSAVGVVAGAVGGMYEDAEEYEWLDQSGVPKPVIIFHGREDMAIPFDGGNGNDQVFEFTAAYDSVNLWLQNNKCNTHPMEITKMDTYTKEIYGECENDVQVVFYAVGGKHRWPGGLQETFKNMSGKNVNATDIMWKFFTAQ